jgi:hypothetical protein
MKKLISLVIAAGLILIAPGLSRADIINGDFSLGSDGLYGWSTSDKTTGGWITDVDGNDVFIEPVNIYPSASVSVIAGQAVMTTQPYNVNDPVSSIGRISLYQTGIGIPVNAVRFLFDVSFDTSEDENSIDPDYPPLDYSIPDWLSVSYVDESSPNDYDRFSFFNIDGTGAYDAIGETLTSEGTYNGLERFSFGITDLRGRTGALYFDLFDKYDEYSSTVILDNIQFENGSGPAPVPEPGTMLLLGSGLAGLAGLRGKRKVKTQ